MKKKKEYMKTASSVEWDNQAHQSIETYFLWPVGDAVTITDYWNVDVFRTGLLYIYIYMYI